MLGPRVIKYSLIIILAHRRVIMHPYVVILGADQGLALSANRHHFLLLLLSLLFLLYAGLSFPGYSVAHGLTAATEHREGIEPRIISKYLFQILT